MMSRRARQHSRRDFLLGAAGLLVSSYPLWARKPESVLIVGAGMAGLAAALDLKRRGFEVVLLEGRNRPGGRVWTDHSLGLPVDLGAAWIHGPRGNPITELARAQGLALHTRDFSELALHAGGRFLPDSELEGIDRHYKKLYKALETQKGAARDQDTLGQALDSALQAVPVGTMRQGTRFMAASDLEIAYAEDASRLGLKYFDEDDGFEGGDVLFKTGFGSIPAALATGPDIRYNHTVTRIDTSAARIKVTTSAGNLEADRAIITVPLGVLKSGRIVFTPGLPAEKSDAIKRLGMGTMNKVVLRFEKPFWPESMEMFARLKPEVGQFIEFFNFQKVLGQPVIVGLSAGDFARRLDGLGQAAAQEVALADLRAMFGKIPAPKAGLVSAWSRDPFALGSYSHLPPGASFTHYRQLAKSAGERLFFAGEATHDKYPATVHGAFLSGKRAARQIIEAAS